MRAKVCLFIYLTVHLFAQEEVDRTRGVWKPFPSKYLISGPGWSECRRKEELCWPSEWKRKLLAISLLTHSEEGQVLYLMSFNVFINVNKTD